MAASAPNSSPTPEPRPTGDLEYLFQQKFAEAEVTPRASFWDQLDHELVVQQNEQVVQENVAYRRRLVLHRWVAAACLLLALGFGSWAFLWQHNLGAGPADVAVGPTGSAATGRLTTGANPASAGLAATSADAGESLTTLAAAGNSGAAAASASSLAAASPAAALAALGADDDARAGFRRAAGRSSYEAGVASVFTSAAAGAYPGSYSSSYGAVSPRAAQLRYLFGLLARPDTLKPALLALPQLPAAPAEELAAAPETKEAPKLWRRLRLGGSYALSSYNPNINFSHTDGRLQADPVTNALRSYYQDEAEDEYRRNLRAGASHRVAFTASYALNDRWSLLSGAEVAEQHATSATTYGFIDGKQVGRGAADLFNRPAAYMPAPARPRTTSYRYRTATVPVGVRYGASKPGLSVYAKVEAAVSLLLGSRSELEGSPEATRTYSLSSSDSPYRQVLTSVRGGTGVRYQPAAANWNVAVGPTAEAGLTTLNANPSQRVLHQSRPYSIGLEASVEFGTPKAATVAQ